MPHLHLDSVRAGIITYGVCPPGEFNRDIGGRGGHPLCCD
jgi:alanine racemase